MMTGHQAYFWHAGVLAKFFAADAWASSEGAATAWIVPDQDAVDPFAMRVPVRTRDGRLMERRLRLVDGSDPRNIAACCVPAGVRAAPVPGGLTPESAVEGWSSMSAALRDHQASPNGAVQVSRAARDLMSRWIAPAPTCFGTEVAGTTMFRRLVERMMADPDACIEAYNRAAAAHPDARVAPLVRDEVQYRFELPLWWIEAGGQRRRVFVEDLEEGRWQAASPERPVGLAPRALLMTGVLRAWACDLFIHGTGGARYDLITEAWFRDWLGLELAPMVTVSADAFLDLGVGKVETDAAWRAHHARHAPEMLGRTDVALGRRTIVDQIERAPRGSQLRRDAFRRLHDLLGSYRQAEAAALAELDARAAEAAARRGEADLERDRTWAFPLLRAEVLDALRDAFRSGAATG
ncbi:MAG: hypothetical protein KDA21_13925 [Phycisphaerales bacterium]|nr:hypothetical protein [Phycisphaerales bacterium]